MKRVDFHNIRAFRTAVWRHFRSRKRAMPWRTTRDPYKILVSEVMLQQTQVSRVLQKYPLFIKKFQDFETFARASRREVLAAWQGLGYNRRALLLKKCAEIVVREHNGALPHDPAKLVKLPGIGRATAGSIAAFAFNIPAPFIETNIRRVFIHFFFRGGRKVPDEKILKFVAATLPQRNAREWYYALMDYGVMLAKTIPNPNIKSAHYARQSSFRGSVRELRGKILKILIQRSLQTIKALQDATGEPMRRIQKICAALTAEGFLRRKRQKFEIAP